MIKKEEKKEIEKERKQLMTDWQTSNRNPK